MADKNETGWGKRFFWWVLTSPVTLVLGGLMLYYGFRAYILDIDPWRSKVIMAGIAALWLLWLVFKNLIKLLLLALLVGAVFYGYYRYENHDKIVCKEQGRVWNEEKAICQDKTGWAEKLEDLWARFVGEESAAAHESSADQTK